MDFETFSAKTKSDAITEACTKLGVTSDRLEYEVVEEGSSGFLGFASKNAVIKARIKSEESEAAEIKAAPVETVSEEVSSINKEETVKEEPVAAAPSVSEEAQKPAESKEPKREERVIHPVSEEHGKELCERAKEFLTQVFHAMDIAVVIETVFDTSENSMDINLSGDDMGVLIGKRGQTLDSMQYLVSLVVNKGEEEYIRIKVDTENYRQRRKDTLENLAKNIAFKVKRTRRNFALEAMNPYERRIIHSALQNDKYVETYSEGTEPYRHVVVKLRDDAPVDRERRYDRGRRGSRR
jgi:spoIIIJ-associated protein